MNNIFKTVLIVFALIILTNNVHAWTTNQLTTNSVDKNVDIAVGSNDIVHRVYERDNKIYYSTGNSEELVSNGNNPAIAIGPDNKPQIVFLNNGYWNYAKFNDSWSITTDINSANSVDIAVDNNNNAHITYLSPDVDYYTRASVMYTNNTGGSWSTSVALASGYFSPGFGGSNGAYYSSPSIAVDSNGLYHVLFAAQSWQGNGRDSWQSVVVSTNAPIGSVGNDGWCWNCGGIALTKSNIDMDANNKAWTVYSFGGQMYLGAIVGNTWNQKSLGTGSNPTIDVKGDILAIAYTDSSNNVKYIEGTIPSNYPITDITFSIPSDVDVGTYPVVGIGSRFVDYIKSDQVFEGYISTGGNTLTCFGIRSTDTEVCSGNGVCGAQDTCTCENGYTGEDCSSAVADPQVPEFGVIAGAVALIGALGIFAFRRK